ncbi:MAG: molecular chaperone [Alphaproteobacteria bacterium]
MFLRFVLSIIFSLAALPAHAEFILSSSIIEFSAGSPKQKDIEIISRSQENDYVVSEISEVARAGLEGEKQQPVEDPRNSWLLVTPNRTILTGGSRRVLRFVLLKEPDDKEHIFRVAVKPVISGVEAQALVGLKVLVGYEVLVIIRPAEIKSAVEGQRQGDTLYLHNTGNTNILLQSGRQCDAAQECANLPARRIYPGQKMQLSLPQAAPVTYSLWDGKKTMSRSFD